MAVNTQSISCDFFEFLRCGSIISLSESEILIGWGECRYANSAEKFPCWYAPDFFLEIDQPYMRHLHYQKIATSELLLKLPLVPFSPNIKWQSPDWEKYDALYEELQDLLHSGTLDKAVPYVHMHTPTPNTTHFISACLHRALNHFLKNPKTALYGWWNEAKGVLGVTPELLCRFNNNHQLETMACAGTVPKDQSHHLFLNAKLQQEHRIVIEELYQDLSPLGSVTIGETRTQAFGRLAHLITPIRLKSHQLFSCDSLIRLLHPTAALGAFPKKKGRQWLMFYDHHFPRKYYGAPIGVLFSPYEGIIYVAIRMMQWDQEILTISAGGGVLKESRLDQEKEELHLKLSIIQEQFAL